jgi:uncharacterized protein (DUF362 family)/NAD-dependent dihydropyrimidine dehydrogenase PreA subunit
MKPRVSIVKVNVSIENAVKKSVNLLGGIERFVDEGGSYLLKPNLFTTRTPEQGATTDMRIVLTLADMLKRRGAEPIVGECPAMASYARPDIVFDGLGVRKKCEEKGVRIKVLDRERPVKVINSNAEVIKELWFPEYALKCDGVINIPKLKTHTLTAMTCAVKNLFGLQQGGTKAHLHVITSNNPERFNRLLIDIFESIRSQVKLNVVDAVIGMEGDGPTTGDPVPFDIVLAGDDAASVDFVAASIIGWNPLDVGTNLIASERGLGPRTLDEIELLGDAIDDVSRRFRKPQTHIDGQPFIDIRMPIVCNDLKCTRCEICASVCPVSAITLKNLPQVNDELCIQCFCCIELCPNGALKAIRSEDSVKIKKFSGISV